MGLSSGCFSQPQEILRGHSSRHFAPSEISCALLHNRFLSIPHKSVKGKSLATFPRGCGRGLVTTAFPLGAPYELSEHKERRLTTCCLWLYLSLRLCLFHSLDCLVQPTAHRLLDFEVVTRALKAVHCISAVVQRNVVTWHCPPQSGQLSQAAKQTNAELLVIGRRQVGGHLGASGYGIIRESHIPVLSA